MKFLLLWAAVLVAEETPIVIGIFNGRLGNQLFNVAATYAVAWDHGAEAFFPDLIPLNTEPFHPGNYSHVFFRCNPTPPNKPVKFEMFEPPGGYREIPYLEPHYIQLYLTTLCKHDIVFNSTFSWGEGWLNQNPNKIVIAPDVWFTIESKTPPIEDLVPDSWIKLSAKGRAFNNLESYQ